MPSPTLSGQRILGGEKWFHHPSGSENVAGRRKRQKTHPEADWSRYKNHPAVLRAVRLYKWFQWTGMAVIVGSMCTGYGRQRGPKAFLFFGTAVVVVLLLMIITSRKGDAELASASSAGVLAVVGVWDRQLRVAILLNAIALSIFVSALLYSTRLVEPLVSWVLGRASSYAATVTNMVITGIVGNAAYAGLKRLLPKRLPAAVLRNAASK